MGVGEMIFRTVYEVLGAEKAEQEANSVASAYEAAARRINASAPALAGPANVIEQSAKQINKNTKGIKKDIESTGDLAATGFRLTFYALAALTASQAIFKRIFITGMAQSAAAFENAMDRIFDASEMTRDELGKLKNEILALSTSLGQQASEIASFFAEATVLQFPHEQVEKMTEAFSLAADATSADFQKLAVGATRLMALWRQPAERAPTLAAQLVRLANKTGRSVTEELLPVLTNVAPLLPGIAQEQLMALVQVAGRFGEDALKMLPQFARKIYSASKGAIPPNLISALLMLPKETILEALGAGRGMHFLEYLYANIHAFDDLVASMKAYRDTTVAMKYLQQDAAQELWKFDAAIRKLQKNLKSMWQTLGSGVLGIMAMFTHGINNIVTAFNSMPAPIKAAASSLLLITSIILGLGGTVFFVGGTIGILVNRFLIDFNQQIEKGRVNLSSWSALWQSLKGSFSGGNFEYAKRGWQSLVNLLKVPLRFLAPFVALFTALVLITSNWANDPELNKRFPMLAATLKMAKSAVEGMLAPLRESFVLGKSLVGVLNALLTPVKGLLESFGAGFVMGFVTPFIVLASAMHVIAEALDLIVKKIHEFGEAVGKIKWLSDFLHGVGVVLGTIGKILAAGPGSILGFMLSVIMLMRVFSSLGKMIAGFWMGTRGFIGGTVVPWMRRTGMGTIMGASPGMKEFVVNVAKYMNLVGFRRGLPYAAALGWKMLKESAQNTAKAIAQGAQSLPQRFWGAITAPFQKVLGMFRRVPEPPPTAAGLPEWIGKKTFPKTIPPTMLSRSSGGTGWIAGMMRTLTGKSPPGIVAPGFAQGPARGLGWLAAMLGRIPVLTKMMRFLGGIGKFLGRIPLGAPLAVLIDLITGASLPRALGGGLGMGIGSLLAAPLAGAAAGAIGGPIGSAVGFLIGLAGSIGGYMLGSHIGGLFEGPPPFQPALAPEGPMPLNVQFVANVTVQTSGTTAKQAEEIAYKVVEIFNRQKENLLKEIEERRRIAREIGR